MEKRIYKTSEGAMLAGVCAGLSQYLNVDVTLIRLGFILVSLAGGAGVLGYIVAAIVMPDKRQVSDYHTRDRSGTVFEQPAEPISTSFTEHGQATESPRSQPRPAVSRGGDTRLLALILIGVGSYILVDRYFNLDYVLRHWWPVLIVALGVVMLGNSFTHHSQ